VTKLWKTKTSRLANVAGEYALDIAIRTPDAKFYSYDEDEEDFDKYSDYEWQKNKTKAYCYIPIEDRYVRIEMQLSDLLGTKKIKKEAK
jgi:hypothetical protein